jgi:hypothetical protein
MVASFRAEAIPFDSRQRTAGAGDCAVIAVTDTDDDLYFWRLRASIMQRIRDESSTTIIAFSLDYWRRRWLEEFCIDPARATWVRWMVAHDYLGDDE